MSAGELMEKEVSPIKWVIPGILPEGLTVLAAKPKVGKSTLSLDTTVAVAQGDTLLGLDYKPLQGRTVSGMHSPG
jgi:RecA-family ATPase